MLFLRDEESFRMKSFEGRVSDEEFSSSGRSSILSNLPRPSLLYSHSRFRTVSLSNCESQLANRAEVCRSFECVFWILFWRPPRSANCVFSLKTEIRANLILTNSIFLFQTTKWIHELFFDIPGVQASEFTQIENCRKQWRAPANNSEAPDKL